MGEYFKSRVPLNPEDAARNRDTYHRLLNQEDLPFQAEMQRLGVIANAKNQLDAYRGPQDQETNLAAAMKFADKIGATGSTPHMQGLTQNLSYMASEPDSRNVYMQATLIPEQALMHGIEALSGDKPLMERGKRLAMAIPSAFFPEIGYPIQPAYDRMYKSLGPIAGAAVDLLAMPGPVETLSAGRGLLNAADAGLRAHRIPTSLVDQNGQVIRQLLSTPRQ